MSENLQPIEQHKDEGATRPSDGNVSNAVGADCSRRDDHVAAGVPQGDWLAPAPEDLSSAPVPASALDVLREAQKLFDLRWSDAQSYRDIFATRLPYAIRLLEAAPPAPVSPTADLCGERYCLPYIGADCNLWAVCVLPKGHAGYHAERVASRAAESEPSGEQMRWQVAEYVGKIVSDAYQRGQQGRELATFDIEDADNLIALLRATGVQTAESEPGGHRGCSCCALINEVRGILASVRGVTVADQVRTLLAESPATVHASSEQQIVDTQILDWLEATLHSERGQFGIDFFGATNGKHVAFRIRGIALDTEGASLREAIRKAMGR